MVKRQITIRRECPRKLFYEKVLHDWKESTDDRNQITTIFKAELDLRGYQKEITGFSELKDIKGIGNNIATKLDDAWHEMCSQFQAIPTVGQIKELKKGEFVQFMDSAAGKKKGSVPVTVTPATKTGIPGVQSVNPDLPSASSSGPMNMVPASPGRAFERCNSFPSTSGKPSDAGGSARPSPPSDMCDDLLCYSPSKRDQVEVCLIVDNREVLGSTSKGDICAELNKLGTRYELRSLSIGDYLWVLRWKTSRLELVLDYICEHKTWQDLKSSKKGRFDDQKQRLMNCEVENIVLIVEGATPPECAMEQALASSSIRNSFMFERPASIQDTAKFLHSVSNRLMNRIKNSEETKGKEYTVFIRHFGFRSRTNADEGRTDSDEDLLVIEQSRPQKFFLALIKCCGLVAPVAWSTYGLLREAVFGVSKTPSEVCGVWTTLNGNVEHCYNTTNATRAASFIFSKVYDPEVTETLPASSISNHEILMMCFIPLMILAVLRQLYLSRRVIGNSQ
uniref:Crossover junction endonuclease MUS81 n=1 Tax=Steinernema glaseri TaxID=37863 RepID=A0A1I7YKS6_9BILA